MSTGQNPASALAAETVTQPTFSTTLMLPTTYFAVSPLKLIVMSTCTFGLYEIYWFYRHWCSIQLHEKANIMPFARAFFAPLFCYALFKRIQITGESHRMAMSLAPGPLAAGWFVFTILVRLPDPYWLISFFAVLFLVPVQRAANQINLVTCPNHDPNSKFSKWNILGVILGGLLLVLMLIGTFLPPK
jgi:hypothetical protein